jgi:hypothetical protein
MTFVTIFLIGYRETVICAFCCCFWFQFLLFSRQLRERKIHTHLVMFLVFFTSQWIKLLSNKFRIKVNEDRYRYIREKSYPLLSVPWE